MESWVEKHHPQTTGEVQGQDKAVKQLHQAVRSNDKPILLYGPPGTGKTSAVYAVAGEEELEVIEVNASDFRNKKNINKVVGGALQQQSLVAKGKVILVDEVDGLAGNKDRGGVQALTKLVKDAAFPVVMTANDPYDKKLRTLRKKCTMVEFGNLNYRSVRARLRQIADEEGIEYDDDAMTALARRAGGDMRGAINDLQTLGGDGELTKEEVDEVGQRQRKDSIFDALTRVFKTTDASLSRGAFDETDADLDEVFLWIENNIENEYTKPQDLAAAFDILSRADIFKGRIMNWQYYRFYVYCYDFLTAGISLAKEEKYGGYTRWKRSRKPLRIWQANRKYKKKESVAERVGDVTHTSTTYALQHTVPFLKAAPESFREAACSYLELDEKEAAWLLE
jgi:replication factor C large subunit